MTKDIQSRLALSLDKANKKEAAKGTVKDYVQAENKRLQDNARKCKKLSVSLFEADLKKIQEASAVMIQNDFYPSPSLIIKLALRTAPLTDMALMRETFAQIKAEDGRIW
jgi:hypothetical protein